MNFLERVLIKLHFRKPVDYNSIEYLRSRGVQIGENVHLFNTNIDFGHGFLVSIGDNVTLTGITILAHDASTQIPLGVSKVGRVKIGNPARVVGSYADFVERHRTNMGHRPVFSTYWADKSDAEKEEMKAALEDGIGYDR